MSESETYKELGALTRCKERWEECIPYVASLLTSDSVKIQAKALWMLEPLRSRIIRRSSTPGCMGLCGIQEAIRVVKSAPQIWTPGKRKGEFVDVTYTFPVIFQLPKDNEKLGPYYRVK